MNQHSAFCNCSFQSGIALKLTLLALAFGAPALAAESGPSPFELPEINVIATTPVGGMGISPEKYPGNVQIINHRDMSQDARTLPDMLNQSIGSMSVNETQGNPYVVDLNYRGFTASPVLGTLAEEGRVLLQAGQGTFPRSLIAAALPAVLARRDLRRTPLPGFAPRGLGDKLAVVRAAVLGRI